jgi:dTDP-glucose 4,6-dehydratase
MRVLVTGGAGFIGSNFVRYLLKCKRYKVNVLDKLTYAGRKENLKGVLRYINFMQGDICNPRDVDKAIKGCKILVNFAAESHVDRSIRDANPFLRTNFFGVHVLLNKALEHKVDLFVQISSDEVYGSIERGSFKEDAKLNPTSPYAVSKACADLLSLSFYKTFKLPLIIIRASNNYGPYQYPEKFIPLSIIRVIKGQKIPVYGNGLNVRDWLYVEDNCRAIEMILRKGKVGEIYNISSGNERRNLEVARFIIRELGRDESLIEFVKDRPAHDFRYSIDSSKIRKLGWEPKVRFEEGLRKTIRWYLENRSWWEKI